MLRKANNCALMGVMLASFMLVVSPKLIASELGDNYKSPDNSINVSVDYNEENHSIVVAGQIEGNKEIELDTQELQEDIVLENTEGKWENNKLLLSINAQSYSIQYEIGIAETGELFCNIL